MLNKIKGALFGLAIAYRNLEEVEVITRLQSQMTHYDQLADEACVSLSPAAKGRFKGSDTKRD